MLSENLIQEFALPYNQLVRLEFAENKCAKFGTLAKLRLNNSINLFHFNERNYSHL